MAAVLPMLPVAWGPRRRRPLWYSGPRALAVSQARARFSSLSATGPCARLHPFNQEVTEDKDELDALAINLAAPATGKRCQSCERTSEYSAQIIAASSRPFRSQPRLCCRFRAYKL